jgi:putative hemolysin
MDGIWIELILIGVSIVANGFFAGSELALVAARPSRLAELRVEGLPGAGVAAALKREPERFLAAIQIAITLVGTLASALGGAAAVDALRPWLASLGLPGAERWSEAAALGIVIVLISFVSLVLGELTPKALALRNPERWAARVARPIDGLVRLVAAPGRILTWSSRIVLTGLGMRDAPRAPLVSEEEVKYLVREGASLGVFEPHESDLVDRVFRFTDTAVRHVMVPRPNIRALDLATPAGEVLKVAVELGHTRLPVYRETLEEAVGVVVIKDLFRCAAEGTTPELERLLHPLIFVPEVTQTSEVLRQFQRRRLHLALVVDEYGKVVGMVTTEDLLEEIVGEIRDEGESPQLESATRLADGSYIIDGTATTRDLREQAGLPVEDSPDYQTIAGFVLHRLGLVPRPGATLSAAGYRWTVLEMEGPRILKIKAEPERA